MLTGTPTYSRLRNDTYLNRPFENVVPFIVEKRSLLWYYRPTLATPSESAGSVVVLLRGSLFMRFSRERLIRDNADGISFKILPYARGGKLRQAYDGRTLAIKTVMVFELAVRAVIVLPETRPLESRVLVWSDARRTGNLFKLLYEVDNFRLHLR
ncbi:hypothetical protein EVAR_100171_1 [Eumeta japonica]|uniref:Uncharacterized protein n=1 Tax=Eumeta variegata TaxID=151549 RepID=A0A4C2A5X6_EUMVA|nr:hypothetical protein EVAR_100171_1 [Eumeta japonica]